MTPDARRGTSSASRTSRRTRPIDNGRRRTSLFGDIGGDEARDGATQAATSTSGSTRPTRSTSRSCSRARSGCCSTTGECLLRTGDVVVQRGTAHSWSNRPTGPAAWHSCCSGRRRLWPAESLRTLALAGHRDISRGDVIWRPDGEHAPERVPRVRCMAAGRGAGVNATEPLEPCGGGRFNTSSASGDRSPPLSVSTCGGDFRSAAPCSVEHPKTPGSPTRRSTTPPSLRKRAGG